METSPASPPPPAGPRPSGRLRALAGRLHPATWPLLLGAAGTAGLLVVHAIDPNQPGNYPTCPWLTVTGTWCPGCGTTRAVHALTNLDIAGAAQMNVLLLALLPYMAYLYGRWLYRSFRPDVPPARGLRPVGALVLLLVVIGYTVVRNTPFGLFLAPGGVPAPAPVWG
ncbi:DUF2752 domain-containing protein [Nocardiopsis sp. RSe5-2]|uniref:DUF2752 domain-containing protein n=1 Tax=Nocardiopsis endophytica TaxID=3018445 RepID=A0ABT4U157_9ACTN|nr:DUF2752 domain-containing protein [Nocardiopsis endophytica]MDA2810686.1 DUF2752 domain-containing protein [Nocardiopsis endophytica]